MSMWRMLVMALMLGLAAPCGAKEDAAPSAEEARLSKWMDEGAGLLRAGKAKEAIPLFDNVVAAYEKKYQGNKTRIYSARGIEEGALYAGDTAFSNTNAATILGPEWAYAYFLKAYALVDLGQMAEARRSLEKALVLSPRNSQFLSELGNMYQAQRDWPKAMETFEAAEDAARTTSPPAARNIELARALRGVGYVLTEQNRLDEAEKKYRECLQLDSNDAKAKSELAYIAKLRASRGGK